MGWMENFSNCNSYGQVSQLISTVNKVKNMIFSYYLLLNQNTNTKIIKGVWNEDVHPG